MNWTTSMQEGWFYYTTNDLDHPDGIKWMDASVTQADLDEMEITLLGPVPAPGTTWTEKQIMEWCYFNCDFHTSLNVRRNITHTDNGIAATTARRGKEQV